MMAEPEEDDDESDDHPVDSQGPVNASVVNPQLLVRPVFNSRKKEQRVEHQRVQPRGGVLQHDSNAPDQELLNEDNDFGINAAEPELPAPAAPAFQSSGGWASVAAVAPSKVSERREAPSEAARTTACLSMHQPWASLLVYGIKRVEGRSWSTTHRGLLWIASTAQECQPEHLASMRAQYAAFPSELWPKHYPSSHLLGCVEVVDCISNQDYQLRVPEHLREENGSEQLLVCEQPYRLLAPVRISGRHKIWDLERKVVERAAAGLEAAPASLVSHNLAAAAPLAVGPNGLDPLLEAQLEAALLHADDPAQTEAFAETKVLDLFDGAVDRTGMAQIVQQMSLGKAFRPKVSQVQQLAPGLCVMRKFLSVEQQSKIVAIIQAVNCEQAPETGFQRRKTKYGTTMHFDMMSMGRIWDHTEGYVHGRHAAPIPEELAELAVEAAVESAKVDPSLPATFKPDLCLANFYSAGGRLGMHQDKDESKESLWEGLPVVSFSIGDSCDFSYAPVPKRHVDPEIAEFPGEKTVRLDSGDMLIFGGPSRMVFHAVRRVHSHTRPKGLIMRPGRLNLTFRQY